MISAAAPARFRLLCRDDGSAVRSLRARGLRLRADPLADARDMGGLCALVAERDRARCERFVEVLRLRGAAFHVRMRLLTDAGALSMYVAGFVHEQGWCTVVGARQRGALLRLLDSSWARAAAQPQAGAKIAAGVGLDELTRLNNELATQHRALAKRAAELSATAAQRNEVLGVAAHDLRNPLLVVKGYCDLLLSSARGRLAPEQRVYVERVQEASDEMLQVLEGTLDLARIESGAVTLKADVVNFAELVQAAVRNHRLLAGRKQIEISVDVRGSLPKLRLDATRMTQVLGNLLSNAIKYSPRGGQVEVGLKQVGGNVVLSVADHGEGIPEHELARLFEPFHTASSRPTAGESSTGLGLAIVRRIVEAHGGDVSVHSVLHGGTTFRVALPVAAASASEPEWRERG